MAEWNFDMSTAPKGDVVTRTRTNKKGKETRWHEHVPEFVWAASACGKVIRTKWLPDAKRWEGFSADVPPIAWQPFRIPLHPHVEEKADG